MVVVGETGKEKGIRRNTVWGRRNRVCGYGGYWLSGFCVYRVLDKFYVTWKVFFFFLIFLYVYAFFFYIYIYCVDVENCRSFKSFSYIYIYIDYVSLVGIIRSFSIKKRTEDFFIYLFIIMFACHDFSETVLPTVNTLLADES